MNQREADLLWLKDLLDHLKAYHKRLEWARDPATVHYLTETMLRDLDCCRRLCLKLNRKAALLSIN